MYYQGRKYSINSGSYVLVPEHSLLGTPSGFTLQCWIYPTTPMKLNQGIFTNWCVATQTGYGLLISDGGKSRITTFAECRSAFTRLDGTRGA